MALSKRGNSWQVKLRTESGSWITRTFDSQDEAIYFELSIKLKKLPEEDSTSIRFSKFFEIWWNDNQYSLSGWRITQKHYFKDYIEPVLGGTPITEVTPAQISSVLSGMQRQGLSSKTQFLVYGTLKKLFSDAIEIYQLTKVNPVLNRLKPTVPSKESPHLTLQQSKMLLDFVQDKPFGILIWVQLFVGLRASEALGLRWEDINFEEARMNIKQVFVKATQQFRLYPKGKKQHSVTIPNELLAFLSVRRQGGGLLTLTTRYQTYQRALDRYCKALGLPLIGTHGLRHSCASLYFKHGAQKEDIQTLFKHSSMLVTERYIHGWKSQTDSVAKKIKIFE